MNGVPNLLVCHEPHVPPMTEEIFDVDRNSVFLGPHFLNRFPDSSEAVFRFENCLLPPGASTNLPFMIIKRFLPRARQLITTHCQIGKLLFEFLAPPSQRSIFYQPFWTLQRLGHSQRTFLIKRFSPSHSTEADRAMSVCIGATEAMKLTSRIRFLWRTLNTATGQLGYHRCFLQKSNLP